MITRTLRLYFGSQRQLPATPAFTISGTQTDGAAIAIKTTGQAGANDITCTAGRVSRLITGAATASKRIRIRRDHSIEGVAPSMTMLSADRSQP